MEKTLTPISGGQSLPLSTGPPAVKITRIPSSECGVCMRIRKDLDYLNKPCHGWPQLANFMLEHPGFQCFPAFTDLNIKSLLYYQAELDKFRQELHELEWKHHESVNPKLCSDIGTLLLVEGEGGEQMKMVNNMRQVLREYSKTVQK
jgi:hypothetical protein